MMRETLDRNGVDTKTDTWALRLYVAGHSARSIAALANLKEICEQHISGNYGIEVIDLVEKPRLASEDQIFAIPTLIRTLPLPTKRMIGDLSNTKAVVVELELPPIAHIVKS